MNGFEDQLRRLYAEVAPDPDATTFACRLQARLDRAWTARRLTIGLLGAVAALLAAWRMSVTTLAARLEETVHYAFSLVIRRLGLWVLDAPVIRLLHVPAEVLWLLGGLALLAAGLLASRWVDAL